MHVNCLALTRKILRGVVDEHCVRLVRGLEQRQEESPRFVEVYVGHTKAPEATTGKQNPPSARTEVQARLDKVGVPYAICGDTVLMLNDGLGWPLELVSVFSHEQQQEAQQVQAQGGDRDVWTGKESGS